MRKLLTNDINYDKNYKILDNHADNMSIISF